MPIEPERVQGIQEEFISDENSADSFRNSLGSKLDGLITYYKEKYQAYTDVTELDSDSIKDYSEYKALYEFLSVVHNDYIRLDNYRCSNIFKLCTLLKCTDLELLDKIKNYEW